MPKPQAKDAVAGLVAKFQSNLADYKRASYKETQVRIDFIDPFFSALGWDIANIQGLREDLREVIHEDTLEIEGRKKAPDYSFRLPNGKVERKFFLEAKKPAVNLAQDIDPAYQGRRYGWSAKLPVSILTDFEEFSVYDCRVRPRQQDKATVARLGYFEFQQYADHFDEIYDLFSKEAVRDGSLDQFVATEGLKRGLTPVDAEFLKEIEGWRESLARNIALRNPAFSIYDMNFAVQRTIDRIIFLRMAEDRKIEPYGRLLDLTQQPHIYPRLVDLYRQADDRYNAGLFNLDATSGDSLTPAMQLDDAPLKQILSGLYYPQSPYEFSVLGADILGNVYEQFLGKVIRLTAAHRAKVEEKPEVKKAGGVFYTPTYIVEYIVKQTVGPLVEGKSPQQISRLRILDPACGSGSFLIGAYQYLLDVHRQWYIDNNPSANKHKKAVVWIPRRQTSEVLETSEVSTAPITPTGEWRLTIAEKKRILLNNIYGVDIDRQAVNVTQLNLLLKALEGETDQTLQLSLFQERVLPRLGHNIKCGNSLIGPDFYQAQAQMSFLTDEETVRRVNAFDWQAEFPAIMRDGGFDAVIGNPPYVRQEMLGEFKSHFQQKYKVYQGTADLYAYFIEKGVSLLKQGGLFGYIVANKWMRANYGQPLRQWLKQQHIVRIIDFGDLPVFERVTTYPCILFLQANSPESTFEVTQVQTLDFARLDNYIQEHHYSVDQNALDDQGWSLVSSEAQLILKKIENIGKPLSQYINGEFYRGVLTGYNKAFMIDEATKDRLISEDANSEEIIKLFPKGRDVHRYQKPKSDLYLIFTRRGIDISKYPVINGYLSQFKEKLMPKPRDWRGGRWPGRKPGPYKWYEIQDTVAYYAKFEEPKIIYSSVSQRGDFTLDEEGVYFDKTCYFIAKGDKYLLGLLNSKLLFYYFSSIGVQRRGGYFEYLSQYVAQLPIRPIDFTNPGDVAQHDRLVGYVEQMLALHQKVAATGNPADKKLYQRQIAMTDRAIDSLVYELYGLTEEEIEIVNSEW